MGVQISSSLRIVVIGDMKNKELVGDNWSPTAYMRTLKYFSAGCIQSQGKSAPVRIIGASLKAQVKNRLFMKLEIRQAEYFPEYSNYFGIAMKSLKSLYGMTIYGKLFSVRFTKRLLEAGFIQSQCQMSICYQYAPDGEKTVFLFHVYDYIYWYNSKGCPSKLITCELLIICTSIHVNHNFSYEGSFYLCISGYIYHFHCCKILGYCHSKDGYKVL